MFKLKCIQSIYYLIINIKASKLHELDFAIHKDASRNEQAYEIWRLWLSDCES